MFNDPLITETIEIHLGDQTKTVRGVLDRLMESQGLGRRSIRGEQYIFTCDTGDIVGVSEGDRSVIRGGKYQVNEVVTDDHGMTKIVFRRENY